MKSSCIVRGLLAIAMLWMHVGYAQLTKAEYFFDNDPGSGNSNVLSVIAKPGTAFDSATFSGSIPVPPNLKKGVHQLYIRFFDAVGGWGNYETKPFRVLDNGTNVSRLEYFFDTDPGVGNGTLISVNTNIGAEFDISTYSGNIPVPSTLEKGWHQLYFRLYDVNGGWGIYESKPFQVLDQGTNLEHLEYYFDNDPGVGNGSPLAFDAITQSNGTFNGNINTAGLTAGIHILYVRAKHKNGSWSQPEARPFNVFPTDVNTRISEAEYFYDTDPGFGNGISLPLSGIPEGANIITSIATTGLSAGYHMLYVRTRGAAGGWGNYEARSIFIHQVIDQIEWFTDTDPGVGNGTPLAITPGRPLVSYLDDITLPGCLNLGTHKLYIRARTSDGLWGLHDSSTFTINQTPSALALSGFPTVMHPCPGNAFDVEFTSSGAYTTGNIFRVLLSDANGSFSTPVEIGTLTASPTGCQVAHTISVSIPEGTANGSGYRVRVVSSAPVQQADSAENITIQPGNTYYRDADGDGYGNEFETSIACSKPTGYVENADDCNDNDGGVHEGIRYYIDADGDGFGFGTGELICASSAPAGYSANNNDCNDAAPAIYPGAIDFCDGLDNDCNGVVDDNKTAAGALRFDGDNDQVELGNWFNYQNFTVEMWLKPGNTQKTYADIIDNAHTDYHSWVVQQNGSNTNQYSFGVSSSTNNGGGVLFNLTADTWQHVAFVKSGALISVYINGVLAGTAAHGGDIPYSSQFLTLGNWRSGGRQWNGTMDELRIWDRPLSMEEIQNNLNCELPDPSGQFGLEGYYRFNQGFDGCPNPGVNTLNDLGGNNRNGVLQNFGLLGIYSNWVTGQATGTCAPISLTTWYRDADGDGYGNPAVTIISFNQVAGYVADNTDCDDTNGDLNPATVWYKDTDNDGYSNGVSLTQCAQPAGYKLAANLTATSGDCDDVNGSLNPATVWYKDADNDGYSDGVTLTQCLQPDLYKLASQLTGMAEDCDDADPVLNPATTWYRDMDNDGYGNGTTLTQCLQPSGYKLAANLAATSGDCDDNNAQVNPVSQTLSFSGNAGFESSFIAPNTGTPYTTFNFEVKYTDATNSAAPYGYPRVLLDFEGNGNYTGGNDRTIVMSPVDVSDNTTSDGKVFRGSISQLATGTNWKSSVLVVNGSCSTQTALASYPIVQVLPDLEIFANDIVMSAANPPVASPLTVTATIHNNSDFAAENFVVRLINQYIPAEDYGDIIIESIPAHGTGTVTWNITTPPDPAWCPLQVVVDATNLIDETNELNNTALRPFTNGNYNVPGAIEVTANASPEVSYPQYGASVGISGKAIYTGTAVPLVDPSVAGAQVELTLLETGQTFSGVTNSAGNFNISIPRPVTVGTYHVQGTVTDFTLTGAFTTQFTLIVAPCQPDLTSRVVLSANQIVEGQSINAEFRITNSGCAASGPTKMTITQSGGSPSTVGTFDVPALLPGASFTRTVNNILFSTRGTYGFSVTADADATEIEQFENNNTDYGYINVLPNLPDLAPYDGSRGSYAFCNTLPSSVSFILSNSGGAASGPFTTHVKVYFNGNYTETLTHNAPGIAAQGYYSFALPYSVNAIGNYTFAVEVDVPHPDGVVEEVSEANNTASYGISVYACPPPVANLVLLGESCQRNTSLDPVDPLYPGTMTLTARAHNAGNLTAPGPIEVSFSLSNGTSYTASYGGSLAPGQTQSISVTVPTVPPATESLTTMVDPNNLVPESNETDNVTGPENLCWNFKPTVWCQSGPWGQRYVVNQSFQPRIEVIAEGLYYASQVKVRFEVSGPGIAGTINLGDAILDNPRRSCAPNCHPVATLPSTFVFQENGVYTFTMTVDSDNAYTECNEGDNSMSINVTVVNQPDMRILSQYINPSKLNPDVNEPVTLLVSYENLGVNNINDRMKMKILVDEVELTTVSNVAGLITGDKATIAIPTPWSSPLVGAHIIRAIIDSDNSVAEANEMNNEATRAIIVGALANLRFTHFAPSNSFPSVGDGITLNATIWNDGDEATDGEVEFLYINNNGDSVSIGKLPVSVLAGGTQQIQLPWFVTQSPAKLVAKIVNATMLEATYDDNIATAAIGSFTVVINSEAACGPGGNGKLTAVVTGGKAPFTYEWNNSATGALLNAAPGTYEVTVTDADNRVVTAEGTIGTSAGTTYYADTDGDGFGDPGNTIVSCTGAPVGYISNNLDCNDGNIAINPAATEVCDGVDNDCDGSVDEGFTTKWYRDVDTDGFGDNGVSLTNCIQPLGYVAQAGDCDDDDNTIYPNAPELCDGKDNDCDGQTDEDGQPTWYKDTDNDGYSNGATLTQCDRPSGYKAAGELTATNGDCDDADAAINPGATEICDGVDNDCDGQVDEGVIITWFKDADNDGYSDGTSQEACSRPTGYKTTAELTSATSDCDDSNGSLNPATVWYKDADNDGYSDGTILTQCTQPADYKLENVLISSVTDCNDGDAAINPATVWYRDADNDGYSDGATLTQCTQPADYKLENVLISSLTDCNDGDAAINPATVWYRDADNDGYSDGATLTQCDRTAGYKLVSELTAITGDCDDDDVAINPRATEICDGKDNDCDGQVDEGVKPTWYKDTDNDGYSNGAMLSQCNRPAGYKLVTELTATTGDCNDANAAINPVATEVCNGIDDDCDGQVDEGCSVVTIWYRDADKDGYGNPDPRFIKVQPTKPRNYVSNNLDCRDFDPLAYPGAPETGDGIDNNCNGLVDEDLPCLKTWYYDGDGDGYGSDAHTRLSCIQHNGYVPEGGDCKNWDASVYPGATEICDGKDNDCDGAVDEGCTVPVITEVQKPVNPAKPLAKADEPVLEVSLWPNPARDVLMVSLDAFETGKKLEMVLMQVDGKPVATQSLVPAVKGQQVRFDVRAMSAGYYLMQVKQGGISKVKRVVIAR